MKRSSNYYYYYSVSFILEVYVFCNFVFGCLHCLVVATAGHVPKHLLVPVREAQRLVRLLRVALDFGPLRFLDGFGHAVRARARSVHLGDLPAGHALVFWAVNFGRDRPRLRQHHIGVVVLGWGDLPGEPLFVLSEVDAIVLVKVVPGDLLLLLHLIFAVVLAWSRRLLLILHDLVRECLTLVLEELTTSALDIVPPVVVLNVLRTGDKLQSL